MDPISEGRGMGGAWFECGQQSGSDLWSGLCQVGIRYSSFLAVVPFKSFSKEVQSSIMRPGWTEANPSPCFKSMSAMSKNQSPHKVSRVSCIFVHFLRVHALTGNKIKQKTQSNLGSNRVIKNQTGISSYSRSTFRVHQSIRVTSPLNDGNLFSSNESKHFHSTINIENGRHTPKDRWKKQKQKNTKIIRRHVSAFDVVACLLKVKSILFHQASYLVKDHFGVRADVLFLRCHTNRGQHCFTGDRWGKCPLVHRFT